MPGVAAAALLVLALADLPYGYYSFLRLAVTVAAVWIAVEAARSSAVGWAVAAGAVAVLFNPVFPIWLSKSAWAPLDLLSAAVLLCAGLFITRSVSSE